MYNIIIIYNVPIKPVSIQNGTLIAASQRFQRPIGHITRFRPSPRYHIIDILNYILDSFGSTVAVVVVVDVVVSSDR